MRSPESYTEDHRTNQTFSAKAYCGGQHLAAKDCSSTALVGARIWKVRDGSHSNQKNQDGWRQPSAYYGSIETTVERFIGSFVYGPSSGGYTGCVASGLSNPRYDYVDGCSSSTWLLALPPWPSGWVDYARDICTTNAMNDLKDRQVNLAVSLAEMQQTVDMIADAGRALADLILCVRRRNCGGLSKRVRDLDFGNAWLSYRYGWMPLVNDIYGLYELMRAYIRGDFSRRYVKGRSKLADDVKLHHPETEWEGAYSLGLPLPCGATYRSCSCENKVVYSGTYFARCRIDAVLKDDIYTWYSNTGIDDPALVLWELIPYSFVADWFFNIGAWIDSWNAYEGLFPLSMSFTYGRDIDCVSSMRVRPTWNGSNYIKDFEIKTPLSRRKFEFIREAGPAPQRGSLRFLRNPLNTKQLLDSVALVRQRMRG